MSMLEDALEKPRLRNAAATRAAILESARRRFADKGYEESGLRDVAKGAGIDAALISRYFGSKEELFVEALRACSDGGRSLIQGDPAEFGRTIAHTLIYQTQNCDKLQGMLIMLRAAGSPKAAEIVQRAIAEDFIAPFKTWLGGEQAEARARLASSVIMGVALNRTLSGGFPHSEKDKETVFHRLAEVLQRCVDP